MWKIWVALTMLFALGAVPRFIPAVLNESCIEAEQNAHSSLWIDDAQESGAEYWHFLGLKLKITDCLLALFTGGLWWSTAKLWQAGERQAAFNDAQLKLAQDQFNYFHVPRLTIRRERIYSTAENNGINFVLANVGDLVAANIVGNFNVQVRRRGQIDDIFKDSLPPYNPISIDIGELIGKAPRNNRTIEGGQTALIYIPFDILNDVSAMELVRTREAALFFFGYLIFTGPDGVRRDSAFFRTYQTITKTFTANTDPDYEHC